MADSAAQTYPPGLTKDDHSSLVKIAVYFLAVTFILSVVFRFAIRLGIAKTVNISDWLCLGSMIVGVGESVAILLGLEHGLGKKDILLSGPQFRAVAQAEYTADILYVLTLGLAKGSVLILLRAICVDKGHRLLTLTTSYLSVIWTLGGIIALAARCGSHLPWTAANVPRQCMNLTTFWIVLLCLDIISELIIVITPILMVRPIHTTTSKKVVIVSAFMFRLVLVAVSIVRIFYLVNYIPSTNFAFRTVNIEILNQVVMMASITSACIPCLKPFLDVFESGQMAVRLRHGGPHSTSNSYYMHSMAAKDVYGKQTSSARRASVEPRQVENDDDISSDSRSDKMIINKKVEYSVRYENVDADVTGSSLQRSSHGLGESWH